MKTRSRLTHSLLLILAGLAVTLLAGCSAIGQSTREACAVTEPTWLTPPEDSAIQGEPAPAHYYTNADGSILAGAWWWDAEDRAIPFDEKGIKVGWFRPAGADLVLTGKRLDSPADKMESEVPCCYPTRFQASGLTFPTPGCWQITAAAADSQLTFTVWVEPAEE
ncbi:MAG: hypothetical protein P8046_05700 [Anaerolineales bacterium]|jgi:hypothetical protein